MKVILPAFKGTIYNEMFSSSETRSENAFILFHGYPGSDERKADFAQFISDNSNYDVFLFHYEGLGLSQGLFSFRGSIEDSYAYFNFVKSQGYKNIYLMGHSWGGLVVLNLLADLKPSNVKNVFLLSPFNYIPEGEILEQYIKFIYNETLEDFKQPLEIMKKQVLDIKNNFQPRDKVNEICNTCSKIVVFQAVEDDEVSPDSTKEFYNLLSENKELIFFDTDHSFTKNKEEFLNLLKENYLSL